MLNSYTIHFVVFYIIMKLLIYAIELISCAICIVKINFRFSVTCLLYTSDAADERSSVDLGGRRIIKKKKTV